MSHVADVHEHLTAEMVTISTYNQLGWFIELPPELRVTFLYSFASAGSDGHFQMGFSNFVAKEFFDILDSVHKRMEEGEWINLENERIDLQKAIVVAREKGKKFREDISKLTKELTEQFKKNVQSKDKTLTPEEESRIKDLLRKKFSHKIQTGEGLMLVDAELTESDIKDIKRLLGDTIKFIGKVKLSEDGSIDKSSLKF